MKNETIGEIESLFLALGDETRLRLLNIMREREVNVNSFVEITGESQPKISRHLAVLRSAGLVELRRDGKRIHYRIAAPSNRFLSLVLEDTLEWLDSVDEIRRENKKFITPRVLAEETPPSKNKSSRLDVCDKPDMKKNRELEIHLL